jgi:membrane protein DedA with SNARE-associated domain
MLTQASNNAAMALASITTTITDWIGQNGIYAVFALMALDALLPVGGELIMLYAGVLAAGAIAGQQASLFGVGLQSGAESYCVLALAGTLGYLLGAVIGWGIGRSGGRALLERHGRWLHLSPETFERAERWFERFGAQAVFLGRITPVVRSFISIPAGVFRTPMPIYLPLTLAGSAIWCFGFAAAGWALGGSWESFHHQFRYADYVAVAAAVVIVAFLIVRHLRARSKAPPAQARVADDSGD